MNDLEDLIRDTLATRAHDVDGLALDAAPVVRRTGRRWVAVGTVIAVAAALVTVVVLIAPWRSADHRNAGPAALDAAPPAGTQWVSFHGITLTVPESWALGPFPCTTPTTNAVVIPGPTIYCPMLPDAPRTAQAGTVVTLGDLVTTPALPGDPVDIDGHAAYRTSVNPASVPFSASPAYGQVVLPDIRVSVTVQSDTEQTVTSVLDSLEYTPIDHYGCTAQPSGYPEHPVTPGTPRLPVDAVSVVVCEYAEAGADDTSWLLGSRVLTSAEVASFEALVNRSKQGFGDDQLALGTGLGEHVYRIERADGTVWTVTADPASGTVVLTDGAHSAVVPGSSPGDLPGAYP